MAELQDKSQVRSLFSFSAVWKQFYDILPTLMAAGLVSLAGFGVVMLTSYQTDTPLWKLTRDPSEVVNFPPYFGMLSNWGALVWITTAVICLFTAVILGKTDAPRKTKIFIVASGLLSFIIAVDDLFRLHDLVLPRLLDIREGFFYLLYLLTLIAYLAFFARQILQRDYLLFAAALFLFFMSRQLFIDIPYLDGSNASGDILKYFGNVFWLAFFYRTASQEISAVINGKKTNA